MIADKFIDSYISDIRKAGLLGTNQFWVFGSADDNKFISENLEFIKWVGFNYDDISKNLVRVLEYNDKVIVHWFDMNSGKIALGIPSNIMVYAYHWGGDFLEDPYPVHSKKWLGKKTYLKFKASRNLVIRESARQSRYPYLLFTLYLHFLNKVRLNKLFKEKVKQVKRINFLVLHPSNTGDVEITKSIYKYPKLKNIPGFYNVNFDVAKLINDRYNYKNAVTSQFKILVGNSATDTNNHIEAFDLLKKVNNCEIYCPLSYGDESYKIEVLQNGKKIFGDRFFPIEIFLKRELYVEYLSKVDIVYMYHIRSQGFGNIIAALSMGKPVFLKRCNSLFRLFENIGIRVYNADQICNFNLSELIIENFKLHTYNLKILRSNFSDEQRIDYLKRMLA